MQERVPLIQSPIPQHYSFSYPIIAYKSFLSDNSEIVLCNTALKKEPQHIIKMRKWQFICFVNASMMQEITELDKMDSHILFLARHKELKEIRLFMI